MWTKIDIPFIIVLFDNFLLILFKEKLLCRIRHVGKDNNQFIY